jgi:anti-anti-sigma factor
MGDFSVAVEHLDETVLLRPTGELDVATSPELKRALDGVAGTHCTIVVDLSGVTFADCAGLRPLRRAIREGGDEITSVRCFAARPRVERVLRMTGLQLSLSPADH